MQLVTRRLAASVALMFLVGAAQAAVYEIDPSHSTVGFRIRHLVSKVRGSFNDYSGTVNFDDKKPESLSTSVVIKTASINTGVEKRDAHLRTADFFNVEKFPEMTFKSTRAKTTGPGKMELTGDLTMLGVTKPVVLNVESGGVTKDPWGNMRSGFSATGKLNRKDYGMQFNMAADQGGVVLGDEVEILLDIEAVEKKAK